MVSLDSIAARQDPRAARVAALVARADGGRWLQALRTAAWKRFEKLGFPSTRDEAWRHTDIGPLTRTAFAAAPAVTVGAAALDGLAIPAANGPRLTFVNGRYQPEWSELGPLPAGVRLGGLAAALGGDGAALAEPHLGRLADSETASFTALNTACFEDGAWVYVPRGAALPAPVQLLFLSVPAAGEAAAFETHPRVLVVAEEGSTVAIVEVHAGHGDYFANAVTEIAAGPGAIVSHTRVQRESERAVHLARVHARLLRDARFTSHAVSLGAALARCEVEVALAGEGAECALYGLYAAGGGQITDNRTDVEHAEPHCTSNQLYKGILAGRAHGVFNGKVLVAPNAQKTDAHQTNRNLLLSDAALADTNPQLEIYADDVRCTHGATIGRLDETALFYLQSRGIDAVAGREILTHAFARDAVAHAEPAALREALENWIAARLGAFATEEEGSA
jgi:Fe-S cluster assembly protein SufD